jgi:hypothetical protein
MSCVTPRPIRNCPKWIMHMVVIACSSYYIINHMTSLTLFHVCMFQYKRKNLSSNMDHDTRQGCNQLGAVPILNEQD